MAYSKKKKYLRHVNFYRFDRVNRLKDTYEEKGGEEEGTER